MLKAMHGDMSEDGIELEALQDLPGAVALTLKAIEQLLDKFEHLKVNCQAPAS